MLNRKDAPDGFYAEIANPKNDCLGCQAPCPVRENGDLYCDHETRHDRLKVILIKEES